MRKGYIVLFWICFWYFGFSQEALWIRYIEGDSISLWDAKRDFDVYWSERVIQRGCGWKPFQRLYWLHSYRTDRAGNRPNSYALLLARKRMAQTGRKGMDLANWQPLGLYSWSNGPNGYNPGNGRINVVAVHSADSTILYVGSPSGGLWRSLDNGQTWVPMLNTLLSIGISGIAIHPYNPDTIYVGTGDGDGGDTYSIGVLKSTDGGQTWFPTAPIWSNWLYKRLYKVVVHPTKPHIVFAATSTGLYRSQDGGQSWVRVTPSVRISDIEFHPTQPDTIYAGHDELYRSIDGGVSFSKVGAGLPNSGDIIRFQIAVTPAAPDWVYILAAGNDNTFYGFYLSQDGGSTFVLRSSSPNIMGYALDGSDNSGQAYYDLALAVDPNEPGHIFSGGINIWESTDTGSTWTINTHWYYWTPNKPYVHADIHYLTYDKWGRLFAGCDGGIFVSTDNGNTWQDLSSGLQITQFYRIDIETLTSEVLGGAQDNGTNYYNLNGWLHIYGADGMQPMFHPTFSGQAYISIQNGSLYKVSGYGTNVSHLVSSNDLNESSEWVTTFAIVPQFPYAILLGYENLWRSTDGGATWNALTNFSTNGTYTINSISICSSNPSVIYFTRRDWYSTDAELYLTMDGGNTWIARTLPSTLTTVTSVVCHPSKPNEVWITYGGYYSWYKVYRSTDYGQTWQDMTMTGLSDLPVNCLEIDSIRSGIYVGTDLGVYYWDSSLTSWEPFRGGLPNVIVTDLKIHYGTNQIYAGTYGRGVWVSNLHPVIVSVDESSQARMISLYPNPTNGLITIMASSHQPLMLEIFNSLGQCVYKTSVNSGLKSTLNLPLPSGVYQYIFKEGFYKVVKRGKLVIQ